MRKTIASSLLTVLFVGSFSFAANKDLTYEQLHEKFSAENIRPEAKRLKINLLESCMACHIPIKGYREYFREKFGDFSKAGVINKYNGAGNVNNSKLYTSVVSGDMPDKYLGSLAPEKKEELLAAIADWIGKGAPSLEEIPAETTKGSGYALEVIENDLQNQASPKDVRYISLVHIYNNRELQSKVPLFRDAINKLVNSLSWNSKLTAPSIVDKAGLILRFRLTDYNWNEAQWKELERRYPYALDSWQLPGKARNIIINITNKIGARIPIVRGDWLVNQLSIPPLYTLFLGLPRTEGELERNLRVNTAKNIADGTAIRAGFQVSEIAANNRVIERHSLPDGKGYYWKSFDFDEEIGRKDIFQAPLNFESFSKEMIFSLPNGMQGYMLTDKNGVRTDKVPNHLVSDISQSNRSVAVGISCMQCHSRGLKEKADEIGKIENLRNYDAKTAEFVKKLYRQDDIGRKFKDDISNYLAALKGAGVKTEEPISAVASIYSGVVQRGQLLSEMDMTEASYAEFLKVVGNNEKLQAFSQMIEQSGQGGLKRSAIEAQTTQSQLAIITDFLQLKLPSIFSDLLPKAKSAAAEENQVQ